MSRVCKGRGSKSYSIFIFSYVNRHITFIRFISRKLDILLNIYSFLINIKSVFNRNPFNNMKNIISLVKYIQSEALRKIINMFCIFFPFERGLFNWVCTFHLNWKHPSWRYKKNGLITSWPIIFHSDVSVNLTTDIFKNKIVLKIMKIINIFLQIILQHS